MPTQNYLEAMGIIILSVAIIVLGHILSEAPLSTGGETLLVGGAGYLLGSFRTNSVINNTNGNGNSH